jgi:hypothetical protein
LTDKSSDLKGQPLKTSLRVLMGGPQCSTVAKMKSSDSAAADNSAGGGGNPMSDVSQAGKAIGSALGGLFHKKKTENAPTDTAAPAPAVANSTDPYTQFVQMASFTTETATIRTDAIPADRFDVPPDWKKDVPKASKRGDEEFTCPKSGG